MQASLEGPEEGRLAPWHDEKKGDKPEMSKSPFQRFMGTERPKRRNGRELGLYPGIQALNEALRLQNPNLGLPTAATNHSGSDSRQHLFTADAALSFECS